MAQANSAQREPSMEEILASIRRIIEDSDGVRKPVDAAAPQTVTDLVPVQTPAGPVEAEAAAPSVFARSAQVTSAERLEAAPSAPKAEIESFRAELGGATRPAADRGTPAAAATAPAALPQRPATETEATARTFRLADIQAQLAREAAAPRLVEPEQRPLTMVDIQQEIATSSAVRSTTGPTSAARQTGLDEMELPSIPGHQPSTGTAEASQRIESPAPHRRDEKQPDPAILRPAAGRAPDSQTAVAEAQSALTRQSIISPAASRQVAAAFGELSEAFAARSKKTFDDMAEQMLRPMLQEWLDNNLPLLVERLVREEIERVARGS